MVHVPVMFLSEWHEFLSTPCLTEKINLMRARVSMLLKSLAPPDMLPLRSVRRKNLQFGTRTDPSFQRHYRFRPTTWEVSRGKDLSAPPLIFPTLSMAGSCSPIIFSYDQVTLK